MAAAPKLKVLGRPCATPARRCPCRTRCPVAGCSRWLLTFLYTGTSAASCRRGLHNNQVGTRKVHSSRTLVKARKYSSNARAVARPLMRCASTAAAGSVAAATAAAVGHSQSEHVPVGPTNFGVRSIYRDCGGACDTGTCTCCGIVSGWHDDGGECSPSLLLWAYTRLNHSSIR